jgi:AcrR family transcriptional regulator
MVGQVHHELADPAIQRRASRTELFTDKIKLIGLSRMSTADGSPVRPYHHGDLRRALLDAAVQVIQEDGPAALTLRDLARRVGVSHAAPVHHFGDKAGLLTALAVEGFAGLSEDLERTYAETASFLELAVAYVCFAVDHRAHFEVMIRPELYHPDAPELRQARGRTRELLYGPLAHLRGESADSNSQQNAGLAAWSLAHGLATLLISGNLGEPAELGQDPAELARTVARYLSLE